MPEIKWKKRPGLHGPGFVYETHDADDGGVTVTVRATQFDCHLIEFTSGSLSVSLDGVSSAEKTKRLAEALLLPFLSFVDDLNDAAREVALG